MSGKIEYFKPKLTTDLDLNQAFLNQIIVPKISNNTHPLSQFFKRDQEALDIEINRSQKAGDKIIQLNADYGCDFESYMRNSKLKDRKEHVKFMQSIKTEQLAALSPYAQFYVVDAKNLKKSDFKKSAIPISFSKAFDLDFFLKNTKSTSRGEGAGIISVSANRVYNITGDYDPITLRAQFFFSSYEVLINKPAIEKSSLFGLSYGGNNFGAFTSNFNSSGDFFNKVQNITYKELIRRSNDFRIVLEYGWTYSDGVADDILSRKEKELIDKFEKVYYKITPITHKINFNEDGSFTLDVEYIPSPLADLQNNPDLGKAVVDRLINNEKFSKENTKFNKKIKTLQREINAIKKEIEKTKKSLRDEKVSKRIENIFKNKGSLAKSEGVVQTRLFKQLGRLKKAESQLGQLLKNNGPAFSSYVIEQFKENNLFNSYNLKTEIKKSGNSKTINNTFSVKIGREKNNPQIFYFESSVSNKDKEGALEDQVLDVYLNDELLSLAETNEGKSQVKKILSEVGEVAGKVIKDYFPKTNNRQGSVSFIFFKDILRGVYDLSEKYNENNDILSDLPYYILGNVAYPLPNGDKYWCNIGDLAFTEKSLKQTLIDFFKNYPNANFKKFVNFFVQKAIPTVVVNKNNVAAFPSLSYPYYHFDHNKFKNDFSPLKLPSQRKDVKLLQGDKKVFEEFSAKYFNSADIKSSTGCYFIGQSSNLLYENSGIFLGKRVAQFREAFFRKDSDLLDTGISKLIIGSSNGLLQKMSFNSNSDNTVTNLSHVLNEKKPGIPDDIISTNYQYTISATMFGNRIYEFSNLIYVPSYTLGKGVAGIPDNPTPADIQRLREQNRSNDFEIGGLYTINNVSDNLQLANGVYTKSINASTLIRDSQLLLARLKDLKDNKVLFPASDFNQDFASYVASNYDKISVKVTEQAKVVKK